MPNKKSPRFQPVNNSKDLIRELNNNVSALIDGTRDIKKATQVSIGLGKVLIAARTEVSTAISAGKDPDLSFFAGSSDNAKKRSGRKKRSN